MYSLSLIFSKCIGRAVFCVFFVGVGGVKILNFNIFSFFPSFFPYLLFSFFYLFYLISFYLIGGGGGGVGRKNDLFGG